MNMGFIKTISSKNTKPKRKKSAKKSPEEIPYTIQIHQSAMGLFELSIRALMPTDVFHELKRRLELIRISLKKHNFKTALEIVNNLLKNSQETRRT